MAVTPLPAAPTRADPSNFSERGDALMTALPAMVNEFNAEVAGINAKITAAEAAETGAVNAAATAAASANYKGAWSSLTGPLNIPASVVHSNSLWMLLSNVADVTTKTPGVATEWKLLNPLDLTANVAQLAQLQATALSF